METNMIERNEVIDGIAVISRDFEIVTANEDLYKFIGIAKVYSIMDVIHQVDLDDFIDVVNGLRVNQEKSMVIRMKNIDNSYRWVLIRVCREENANQQADEFVVMHISDIIVMKKQNQVFRETIQNFRHIMAMDNELFFTYDYQKDVFSINSFIDNEIFNRYTSSLDDARQYFLKLEYIPEEALQEYEGFFEDIRAGVVSYERRFCASKIASKLAGFTNIALKGTTIYDEMKPSRAVGSFRNLDETENIYTQNTYQFNNTDQLISYEESLEYVENNLEVNKNCELAFVHCSIDHFDEIKEKAGEIIAADIYQTVISTMKKIIGYRGVAAQKDINQFCMIVKDCNTDLNLRSFLEHIRTRIGWECHKKYAEYEITLSMGIVRYPENSMSWNILNKKLKFAYDRSVSKGGNNFVIYREHLHGEITE